MARALRIEVAGGQYHVTARSTEGRVIFGQDRERERLRGLGLCDIRLAREQPPIRPGPMCAAGPLHHGLRCSF